MSVMETAFRFSEILKVSFVAGHFEETKECQLQSIIDNCGKSVATLYKTVFGPVTDVERAVCDDVILPSKDNYYTSKRSARAARPGMFGSMGRIFTFNAFL
ncbi:hypothetical protein AVEN_258277-1 [Araneus ventricosus]|uniref:Uncharacterized protein n=1 Tax=Araneus ventricosus TaxID=182803 RepID=A0A4Y2P727_ARAVE|nr:hypothetical protein AVEN_258277-1 [Araneus ventricosus]